MKTANYFFCIGIGYICLWIGMALASVNQIMPIPESDERYGWGIVFGIAIITIIPFICGLLAGYRWKNN